MRDAWIALASYVCFMTLAFGWRTLRHWKLTGTSGFQGISGRPGSLEWLGGVLFVVAVLLGFAAPVAGLAGWLAPRFGPAPLWTVSGCALAATGLAATVWAQQIMGESWRIGVDARERTALVTRGPFALARNPIFSFMLLHALGMAMLVPNVVALAAWGVLLLAVELQVRFVEEPYLLAVQGTPYRAYAARVGRFVPRIGRL